MRDRQTGLSLMALIAVLVVVAVIALFGMKLIPSYIEYRSAKYAIQAIARENPNASPQQIRKNFEARSTIDNIESIKPDGLDITKQGNDLVISFAYRKEVPLFSNVGVYIDYAASTGAQ
jgi:Tfp pilus assembly protein PilE